MTIIILGFFLYFADIIISLFISISIIDRLYIKKKYNKKEHFHLYNDLFSWEIFFILISISNILQIISSFFTEDLLIFNFLFKLSILIYYNNFWSKMIHSEKLMNMITYERHYFAGIIPLAIVIVLLILNLEVSVLLVIFFLTSLLPYLLISIFLRNTGISLENSIKVCIGSIIIGMGLFFNQSLLKILSLSFQIPILVIDLMHVINPSLLIIGTLVIFESFRKEVF